MMYPPHKKGPLHKRIPMQGTQPQTQQRRDTAATVGAAVKSSSSMKEKKKEKVLGDAYESLKVLPLRMAPLSECATQSKRLRHGFPSDIKRRHVEELDTSTITA
eukprot:TRINITY_DN5171_c1_g1_i1.p1 TRINITY_DN5171_c1_g1~~TRINITY_DN5171_c1_g1_i1.p1  ORF type:complete len:104 (-),score=21.00 TRINITY_DN5171_c1_g1_i1:397-708(-)